MEGINQRLFSQTMDLWILPEIKKRKEVKSLPEKFRLTKAQIIFSRDRNMIKIRLNDEVKAIANAKVNRSVQKGEKLFEKDLDEIESIDLTDNDPNVGHITLLLFKQKWIISFDFRYNKKRVNERLEAAKEFYNSSKDNLKNKRLRPFFENSFACAELLTEALLIQFFDKDIFKSHKSRSEYITKWAELGNIEEDYPNKLKRLSNLRSSARYMSSTEFKNEDPQKYLEYLDGLFELIEKSIS